ncbi:MAG: ribonuclease J [Tenericutes bacterium]|jgi:ribonuclease J|nr:ribonuclease J [Mycoplasmatota bacterium]
MKLLEPNETKIIVLGGLGSIGKNMCCVMHEDQIIIIDAGASFAEENLLGVDYVLPDYTFLKQNEKKIKALIITHGHEDHIGAIPFLIKSIHIPAIYAPNQAKALISMKLSQNNIRYNNLNVYTDQTKLKFKNMEIDFFRTTHSIPDSHGVVIRTSNGTIVSTGDFKFDMTPIGPMADLHKMADIGKKGVDLLISDSTNALDEGLSKSESIIDIGLSKIFETYPNNRVIIATFASNIYRLKHIVEICKENNRKICIFGRSMENNIEIAINEGYINHRDIFISPEVANTLKPGEITFLCTGSQGEPLAALSKLANGTHRQISLSPYDVVVFSSSPIPGNAISISKTINKLYLKGVKVFTNNDLSVHSSGHGNQEELKLMIRLMKPKYFMPFHGDYRMLKKHAQLAIECDIPNKNVFILNNGDILSMKKNKIKKTDSLIVNDIYVEGNRIGEVSGAVIRDRKIMNSDGILIIIANIDIKNHKLLGHVNIVTRGFIMVNENEEFIKILEEEIKTSIINKLNEQNINFNDIKATVINTLRPIILDKTGRKPIIVPIMLDIKKDSM